MSSKEPMTPTTAFRVKLMQKWIIPLNGSQDWGGVWETIGVRDLQHADQESWELRRVMSWAEAQPLGEVRRLPKWMLLECCKCVTIQTIYEQVTTTPAQ